MNNSKLLGPQGCPGCISAGVPKRPANARFWPAAPAERNTQAYFTDAFERITLCDNRVTAATARKLPNGRYRVNFTVKSANFYANGLGNPHPAGQTRDALPVAVFPAPGRPKRPRWCGPPRWG